MPITYDAGTNTITVTGFSEASPCTFEDIYNASVGNGWGVVNKPSDYSYVIKAKLVIGDGSTWTYFVDVRKTVIFTSDVELNYGDALIVIKRHAYFRLGVGDVDKRSGTGGCVTDARDITVNSWSVLIRGEEESNVELYGSTIISERYQGLLNVLNLNGTIARVYDCLIQGGGSAVTPRPNLDMNHVTIEDASYGMSYGYQPAYPFTNIIIKFCYYGVYWYSDRVYNLNNAIFGDIEYIEIHTVSLKASARLTDCELEKWSIHWGGSPTEDAKIERAYTFKVKVTDSEGNPIQNALVQLFDKNDNLVFAELTDSNGEISEHSIVSITYTPTETINNNPYTVVVTKDGYTTLETKITIDKTMKNLVLQLDILSYTIDEIYEFLKGGYGILNRETMHKTGSTIKVRFKSSSGNSVKIYVYKPDGTEVVSGATMTEIGSTGIYYYDLTFDNSWGTGDFLIKCVDEDENIEDNMTITVLSENDWYSTHSEANNIINKLDDIDSNTDDIKDSIKKHDIKMTGLKWL